MSSSKSTIITLIALAFGYSIVRYNIIKGVSWDNFPLYISNKAISLSAVFLIASSYILGPLARFSPGVFASKLSMRKYLGLIGFGLGAIHAVISLLIFNPAYYAKYFQASGKLNLNGELALLFGVLSLFVFAIVAISSIPSVIESTDQTKWFKIQQLGYLALVFVGLHVLIMGLSGWFKPQDWPGGLLPISLVAFSVILLTLLLKALALLFPKKQTS